MPIPVQRSRDLSTERCLEGGWGRVNLPEAYQIGGQVFEEASSCQTQSTQMEVLRLRAPSVRRYPRRTRGRAFPHPVRKSKYAGGVLTAGVLSEGSQPCVVCRYGNK